jgi:hypothetical protein
MAEMADMLSHQEGVDFLLRKCANHGAGLGQLNEPRDS